MWRWTMAVRTIEIRERVMARNDEIAAGVRRRLAEAGVIALNLVSSPGSGRSVLRGRARGVGPVGACHLDASQIHRALEAIDLARTRLLFIENVGNLVCPAGWDLGEDAKVVVFSATEGEDKPLKYPRMFRMGRYAVLNKVELPPPLDFNVERAVANAWSVNPSLRFFFTSARTGYGLEEWFDFLKSRLRPVVAC